MRATKFGVLSDAIITYMDGLQLTAPEGVRRCLLPDGAEAVAAGGLDSGESLLRHVDGDLRQFR